MAGGSWAEAAGWLTTGGISAPPLAAPARPGVHGNATAAVPRGPANAENGVGVEGSRRYGTALVLGAHRAAELGIWWPLA